MRVNPILSRMGSHSITAIQDRARHLRDTGRPLVDFSIGDPREPTPPFIPAALKEAVPAISQYPTVAGLPRLRQAIADYVERRFGVVVDPETEVQPTTGSKESIFSTPLAFVDRDGGDGVVWPTPGYPIYERGGRLAGAVPLPVALSGDFVFRVDDVPAEAWDQARIVWLCSPHNPSGAVMQLDELRRGSGSGPRATMYSSAPTSATSTCMTAIRLTRSSRPEAPRASSSTSACRSAVE